MRKASDIAKEINENGAGTAAAALTGYVNEFGVDDTLIELCKIFTGVIFDRQFQAALAKQGQAKWRVLNALAKEYGNNMPIRY